MKCQLQKDGVSIIIHYSLFTPVQY